MSADGGDITLGEIARSLTDLKQQLADLRTDVSRLAFVVRSGETTVHESPRSVERNTLLPATYSVPGSCGESIIGASHWKR